MQSLVKISSKRQVTIPSKIFDHLKFEEGDNLIFEVEGDKIVVKKAKQFLDELAGSVKIPVKYQGKSLEFIIKDAKSEYFANKK